MCAAATSLTIVVDRVGRVSHSREQVEWVSRLREEADQLIRAG
jgi:hypothetical protein